MVSEGIRKQKECRSIRRRESENIGYRKNRKRKGDERGEGKQGLFKMG